MKTCGHSAAAGLIVLEGFRFAVFPLLIFQSLVEVIRLVEVTADFSDDDGR